MNDLTNKVVNDTPDQASDSLVLSMALLSRPSLSPDTTDCLTLLADRLQGSDFVSTFMPFGTGVDKVNNLWAKRGTARPVVCFVGHTDVVPVGDIEQWTYPPFVPTIDKGVLYARGAADMKTAVACFVVAAERFINKYPNHKGSIALLITGDEEGAAINGTRQVAKALQVRGEVIDYCLVGEPSSSVVLGDTIKNGRRGSLHADVQVIGKQGHVAYPHLAINPIHLASSIVAKLCNTVWDNGNEYFPPTTLQVSSIRSSTASHNVIPEWCRFSFNFRFGTKSSAESLKARTQAIFEAVLADTGANYTIDWQLSGEPFLTEQGKLVSACQSAIASVLGRESVLSTSGGTSDGRFIAPMGAEVVELGVINATIHQVNECVLVADLEQLTDVYEQVLVNLLL